MFRPKYLNPPSPCNLDKKSNFVNDNKTKFYLIERFRTRLLYSAEELPILSIRIATKN